MQLKNCFSREALLPPWINVTVILVVIVVVVVVVVNRLKEAMQSRYKCTFQ